MFKWFKRVFCLLVLGLLIYTGVIFGIPYYKYYAFKTEASEMIRFSEGGLKEIINSREDYEALLKFLEKEAPLSIMDFKQAPKEALPWLIFKNGREKGIPIRVEEMYLTRDINNEIVKIEFSWSETVNIFNLYKKRLDFGCVVKK